jgi:uncharacterized protein (DUF433 family)
MSLETLMELRQLDRITFDPAVMGGKPCIRNMRVTVGMIVGMIASGHDNGEMLDLYPYLEADDILEAGDRFPKPFAICIVVAGRCC